MIASPPINRQPEGLLGFLDIKTQGRNPATLIETVAPTLDLRDFYAAHAVQSTYQRVVGAAAGPIYIPLNNNPASWTVLANALPFTNNQTPQDAVWLLVDLCVSWLDVAAMDPVVPHYRGFSLQRDLVQNNARTAGLCSAVRNTLIPPGSGVGIYAPSGLSATASVEVTLRTLQFRA